MRTYQIKLVHTNGWDKYHYSDLYLSLEEQGPGEPLVIIGRETALDLAEILNHSLDPGLLGNIMIEEIGIGNPIGKIT